MQQKVMGLPAPLFSDDEAELEIPGIPDNGPAIMAFAGGRQKARPKLRAPKVTRPSNINSKPHLAPGPTSVGSGATSSLKSNSSGIFGL